MYTRAALRLMRPGLLAQSCASSSLVARQFSISSRVPLKFSNNLALSSARVMRLQVPFAQRLSTSAVRSFPSGTVDEELAAKIDSEISLESDFNDSNEMPESLKEFIDSGLFKLVDKAGQEEVELIREFGNEKIRVLFSIADLDTMDEKFDDDPLFDSEEADAPGALEETAQKSKDAKSPAQNDQIEEEDIDEEDTGEPAFPVKVIVTIEKPTQGALQIETVAQDGNILIDSVHFHKSAEIATARTAEADWQRRGQYFGPPFANLDEDLQVLMERYLDERGINTALALFVPDYIDYKEQKEYIAWLKNVKSFVTA